MYEKFYGLKEKPFNMTPDPEFLFFTEKHAEAFEHLRYGIRERRGFIEITGEVGAGKTTLCRALMGEFDEDTKIALILNPFLSDVELLRTINEEFYIDAGGTSKKELLDTLNDFLIEQHSQGCNVVLVIDEAQNLPIETLEQIRIISNLETVKAKLIQIVLVGQPELREKLERRELRQLSQRITVRYHINAMNRKETAQYISHRLKVAGSAGEIVFTEGAVDEIYSFSKGIPRMINVICDYALLTGYVAETYEITRDIVKKAQRELVSTHVGSGATPLLKERLKPIGVGVAAAAAVLIAGYFLYPYWRAESAPGPPAVARAAAEPGTTYGSARALDDLNERLFGDAGQPAATAEVRATTRAVAAVPTATPTAVVVALAPPEPTPTPVPQPTATPTPTPEEEIANAPGTPGQFDVNQILRCGARGETLHASLLTVLGLWGFDLSSLEDGYREYFSRPDARAQNPIEENWDPLCLVRLDANLTRLFSLNLPCVLELYEDNSPEPNYAALISVDGSRLVLGDPLVGRRKLDTTRLNRMWFGRALVFCERDTVPERPLGLSASGDEVKLLQARLVALNILSGAPSGFFNKQTEEAVRTFQARSRIQVDGLAGPETGIFLYAALAGPQVPRLRRGSP